MLGGQFLVGAWCCPGGCILLATREVTSSQKAHHDLGRGVRLAASGAFAQEIGTASGHPGRCVRTLKFEQRRGYCMHHKLDIMAETGYVVLGDFKGPRISPDEWESLEYMDWKSGGDTNFAPLASATGEMDCRGFWDHGKADKDGIWTVNRKVAPSLARYVENIGGNYGRVRVIKLNPSDEPTALRQLHRDDNNRLNPDGTGWVIRSWLELDDTAGQSVFILREDKEDPSTETRIRLHPGLQVVIDTERLWHVVWHPGPKPRYALITSWESDQVVDNWIKREMAGGRQLQGVRA
jgi:hypothetical protein